MLMLLCPMLVFAQDDSVQELKNKVQALEQVVHQEKERNIVLKSALDLRNQGPVITVENIKMRINKVYADTKNQSLYIQGLVAYVGDEDQSLQFQTQDLVAPNGNQYQAHTAFVVNNPSSDFHVPHAERDIAYGFLIKFDSVEEQIPTISLLRLRLLGNGLRGIEFNFKGVDVEWH